MNRPVILISDDSAELTKALRAVIEEGSPVEVVVDGMLGKAMQKEFDAEMQRLDYEMLYGTSTFENPKGLHSALPKHAQPRPDIEAWNAEIEERKAAKRRAKGSK